MFKKLIISILLLGKLLCVYAQKKDSIINIIDTTKDVSLKIKAFDKLSEYYIDINKDSAFMFADKGLNLALQTNNLQGKIQSYKAYGIIYFYSDKFTLARKYFKKALALIKNDDYLKASFYYLIGATYYNEDNYILALKKYTEALNIAKAKKYEDLLAILYNAIGILYKEQGEIKKAINYYFKALKLAETKNDIVTIANLYNNIGVLYKNQNLYDDALTFYSRALNLLKRKNNDLTAILYLYNNIGSVYNLRNEYEYALRYYRKALAIAIKIQSENGLFTTYRNIANLYKKQKKYVEAISEFHKALSILKTKAELTEIYNDLGSLYWEYSNEQKNKSLKRKYLLLAIEYSKKAYRISNDINNFSIKQNAVKVLMSAYREIGNVKKALDYAILYIKLNKKLYDIEKLKLTRELKKKYDNEKNKLLIEKLEKEKELKIQKSKSEELTRLIRQRQIKLLLIGIILLILFLIYVLHNLLKSKKISKTLHKLNVDLESKTKEIKFQYLKTVKQNIEINTKAHEIEKQRQTILEKNEMLQDLNNQLIASEEELKQQNDILYQKNEEIQQQQEIITEVVRQFEDTIENLEDVYFKTNRRFQYIQVSPSIQKHLSLNSVNDIIGKSLNTYWIISNEKNKNLTKKLLQGEPIKNLLIKYKTTDNKIRYGKINARALFKNGRFNGVEGIIRDVTSEIEYQNRIKEAVRQFEDTIENLEDIYFKTNCHFQYIQVSPSMQKHLNLNSINDIIGKPLSTYWIISDKEYEKLIQKLLQDKSIKKLLLKYKTTDNKIRYGHINARALFNDGQFNGVEGIIRDVTSEIEYQNKIKELSKQRQVLINNLPALIYYKDINLRYIEINNHFAEALGKRPNEIIGKTDEELLPNNKFILEYEELDKKVIKTKRPILNYQKQYFDQNNKSYWMSISKIPYLDKQNNVAGIIGVVRDITEQVEYEKKLKDSKNRIEQAHKHITDNINYAKRIQQALLPTQEIINGYFKENFILYLPKDNVSGDFYFLKKIEKFIVFAVADCTGHGVSGGFLTMLGITNLNDIITKDNVSNPGKILNELRDKFKKTYTLFGSENKDGLDIALCTLNTKNNELMYAGAFNPLWIIRNNNLTEYKATRNPIGFYALNEKNFVTQKIQLKSNDLIYLFSDGFSDQFGGESVKGKKYSSKRLKQFLISINALPLEKQKEKLINELKNWQKNKEQIDDITILGIKIS